LKSVAGIAFLLLGTAFACVWAAILLRLEQGRPVLPFERRRRVPWRGVEVLLVLLVFLVAQTAAATAASHILGPEASRPQTIINVSERTTAHPVVLALQEGGLWVVLLCGLSAVVVAPIVEEFFFRVLLQGWLEAAERRWRRRMPTLRRLLPGASGPILVTSFLFGMMHFRAGIPDHRPEYYLAMILATSVGNLATMAFAVVLLRLSVGATAADLGWMPQRLWADLRLGVLTFAAVGPPIYAAQLLLPLSLPAYLRGVLAPDPPVLFVFALVLGMLYRRTHRIAPPLVLHFCLNATSLLVLWVAVTWK
jgi:membrane protease YdiL (CAAX protease family)